MASSIALREAVQQAAPRSLLGLQQRLFSTWFDSFIYNQIWEDPRVDLQALQLQADSRVLTIASGGCNVLNYLTASPAHITAIDLNTYHLALTRLKIAAFKYLPDHATFYNFFGHASKLSNLERYQAYIQPQISPELDQFWFGSNLLGRQRISMFASDFYKQTRFGYFMRGLHWLGRRIACKPQLILKAKSRYEQKLIFKRHIEPFFEHPLVKLFGKLPMSVFSLGIPPQQYQAMQAEGSLLEQYRQRVERLACDFPIQDNYFAWQAFGHSYDHANRQALPDYLKAEHYQLIKTQLHKVETQFGSIIDYLKTQDGQTYDRFVFLDAQDWMSAAVLTELWTEVLRVAKPETRIIFRTAAATSPLEQALPPELLKRLVYEAEESAALFKQDRSAIYGGFHLYRLVA